MPADGFPRPATFTDAEFDRMIAAGAFFGRRVELREGRIVEMSPVHTLHALSRRRFARLLEEACQSAYPELTVGDEVSVRFGNGYYPTPDILVWTLQRMRGPVLGPEVRLIVEVADETLADDLGEKKDLYAAAGTPEYWVVDVNAHVIHGFSAPVDGRFTHAFTTRYGETLRSATLADLAVDTATLPVA